MTTHDWLSDLSPAFSAQESWRQGVYDQPCIHHLVYLPEGAFSIAAGAGLLAEHVRRFRFSPEVIARMGRVTDGAGRSVFDESYLNFLQRLRLRVAIQAAPEGALLLPGEPVLILRGPLAQVQLLQSALRLLVWDSTHWATRAAYERWRRADWPEEDTPAAPPFAHGPVGWKRRALYIGGAVPEEYLLADAAAAREPGPGEWLQCLEFEEENGRQAPLTQVRRLFNGNHPLGDVWLTADQEAHASVSKPESRLHDAHTHRDKTVHMSRFQNLYQPLLVKGHPVWSPLEAEYLRQRTLKQLEAFEKVHWEEYPFGWSTEYGIRNTE